jgi:hypothetical protein
MNHWQIRPRVRSVALPGSPGKLQRTRNPSGLTVSLPRQQPGEHAFVLKLATR